MDDVELAANLATLTREWRGLRSRVHAASLLTEATGLLVSPVQLERVEHCELSRKSGVFRAIARYFQVVIPVRPGREES